MTAGGAGNLDHYGIDEEGPAVNVPVTTASLTQGQETALQEARDAIFQSGDEKETIAYQVVLQIASFYLN